MCAPAFCTFNWIDDKEGAFVRLAENLKPGGKALIVVPADFDSTEQLYKEWVLQAGLTICDWEKERVDVVFHNEDEMRSWMKALFFDLSDDEFERLFEGHLRLVHGHYPQAEDGRIYAFPHRLTMLLQK